MSTQPATTSAGILARLSPHGRLVGLDAARGLALLTMMITHIFPLTDEAMPTWATSTPPPTAVAYWVKAIT